MTVNERLGRVIATVRVALTLILRHCSRGRALIERGRRECGRGALPAASPTIHGRPPDWKCQKCQLTIQPALLAQETDLAVRVAPDKADNDSLLLPALEAVYTAQLNTGEGLLQRRKDRELGSSQVLSAPWSIMPASVNASTAHGMNVIPQGNPLTAAAIMRAYT
jgi:hypothetical protein